MFERRCGTSTAAATGLAAAMALALGLPVAARADAPTAVVDGVRMADGVTRNAVRRAVAGARRRLQDPTCGAVVAAFHDKGGQPLLDPIRLGDVGAADHLSGVLFFDGSDRVVCSRPTVPAATLVGSRVVLVCPRQFVHLAQRDVREAEFVVIHEMLHTLGLPENPPTPSEIHQEIAARCGR